MGFGLGVVVGPGEGVLAAAGMTVGLGECVLAAAGMTVGLGEEVAAADAETVGLTAAIGAVSGGGELPSMALMAKNPPATRMTSAVTSVVSASAASLSCVPSYRPYSSAVA